jgi:hypothetical protein
VSKCDLCSHRSSIHTAIVGNILGFNREVQAQRDATQEFFSKLELYCLPCVLLGKSDSLADHDFVDCPYYYRSLSKEVNKIQECRGHIQERYLKLDSCCYFCYLPTYLYSSLRTEGSRCCKSKIMRVFFAMCVVYYKELNLEDVLRVQSFRHWNWDSLLKVFFTKVTLEDLNTQAIQGIAILRDMCIAFT